MSKSFGPSFENFLLADARVIGWVKSVDALMKAAGGVPDAGIVALDSGLWGSVYKLKSDRIWTLEPMVRPIA